MEENKELTQEKTQEKTMCEKVNSEVERLINKIVEDKLQIENVEILGELIDIHKDLANEKYWKVKEENYMYRESYGRGRYNEGGYGRRGVPGSGRGRYRGQYGNNPEEMMEEMKEQYMEYNEGREQYNRGGSYNGEEQMIEATEGIMKNITEIVKELAESDNPEVIKIIQKHARKIMEM